MAKQPAGGTSDSRRGAKSAAAFRTISEVAAELDLPQHVLRFWETKFKVIKPMKRGGGRRYYRPEDVALLRNIRDLLYTDGYTIKGVQKLLRKGGGKPAAAESSFSVRRIPQHHPACNLSAMEEQIVRRTKLDGATAHRRKKETGFIAAWEILYPWRSHEKRGGDYREAMDNKVHARKLQSNFEELPLRERASVQRVFRRTGPVGELRREEPEPHAKQQGHAGLEQQRQKTDHSLHGSPTQLQGKNDNCLE